MNLCDIFAELILYIAFFLLLVNNMIITSLNTSKNRREREENIFLGYLKGVTLPNCHISFKNCLFGRKYDIPNIFDYSYGKKNKNNDNSIVRNAEHRSKKYDTGNINLLAIFKSVNKCKKDELFKKILYVNEQRWNYVRCIQNEPGAMIMKISYKFYIEILIIIIIGTKQKNNIFPYSSDNDIKIISDVIDCYDFIRAIFFNEMNSEEDKCKKTLKNIFINKMLNQNIHDKIFQFIFPYSIINTNKTLFIFSQEKIKISDLTISIILDLNGNQNMLIKLEKKNDIYFNNIINSLYGGVYYNILRFIIIDNNYAIQLNDKFVRSEESIFCTCLKGGNELNYHLNFEKCLFEQKYDATNTCDFNYLRKNKNDDIKIIVNVKKKEKKFNKKY